MIKMTSRAFPTNYKVKQGVVDNHFPRSSTPDPAPFSTISLETRGMVTSLAELPERRTTIIEREVQLQKDKYRFMFIELTSVSV